MRKNIVRWVTLLLDIDTLCNHPPGPYCWHLPWTHPSFSEHLSWWKIVECIVIESPGFCHMGHPLFISFEQMKDVITAQLADSYISEILIMCGYGENWVMIHWEWLVGSLKRHALGGWNRGHEWFFSCLKMGTFQVAECTVCGGEVEETGPQAAKGVPKVYTW